jgi:hypothetical protein
MAPVITRQAIFCSLLGSAWLVFELNSSHHCGVYPICHLSFKSPGFAKRASACPDGFIGLVSDLAYLIFACQSLVYCYSKVFDFAGYLYSFIEKDWFLKSLYIPLPGEGYDYLFLWVDGQLSSVTPLLDCA